MKALLFSLACCCLLSMACRKNRNSNDLVGHWKLIEISRISQPWEAVALVDQGFLQFNNDGTFSQINPLVSSASGCTGTYSIQANNLLIMRFNCGSTPQYNDELGYTVNGNTLILDHYTTATGIKTKYVKE